jgi:hypothetical protein
MGHVILRHVLIGVTTSRENLRKTAQLSMFLIREPRAKNRRGDALSRAYLIEIDCQSFNLVEQRVNLGLGYVKVVIAIEADSKGNERKVSSRD